MTTDKSQPSASDSREPSAGEQLDSWKEIAAYFKRDERTVRRWEKREGLPVRRHLHDKRATVYASKAELDAWWSDRRPKLEAQQPEALKPPTANRALAQWPVISVGIGGLLLIAALLLLRASQPTSPSDPAAAFTRLTADSGLTMQPTLSADGEILAYASDRAGNGNLDIWMQRIGGGEPVRLTEGPMDADQPSLSPDGTHVAFRSARDGGGLYVMPASSGAEQRLIASGGFTPRFSPDGQWIAYTIGYDTSLREGDPSRMALNQIFIVPAAGGPPRRIAPEFGSALGAIWSPDGRHLLFWGMQSIQQRGDWWVIPVPDGAAAKTGLSDALRRHEISAVVLGAWRAPNRLLLSGSLLSGSHGDVQDIWEWELDLKSWQASDTGRRVTTGAAAYLHPYAVGDRLVLTARTFAADIWTLPMQADEGTITGPVRRLTQTAHLKGWPSISADGRVIAHTTPQPGGFDIWTLNTVTGIHSRVVPSSGVHSPVVRPDGARVAYGLYSDSPPLIEAVPTEGGPAERLCSRCGWGVSDWSADGRWLLHLNDKGGRMYVSVLDVRTGMADPILRHPRHGLYQPHFSSDGRWVAFMEVIQGFRHSRLWAAPFRNVAMVLPEEWVALTDGEWFDDKPRWSPDGSILYFVSWRDGFPCIWGRRVDRDDKTPIGEPFDVYHSHDARLAIRNITANVQEISVARDRIIFNMGEMTGNIWSLPLGGAK